MIRRWADSVVGSPALLTRRQTWIDVRKRLALTTIRLVEDIECPVRLWDVKTATAALGLLATTGVSRIDVYGADWTDQPDFDGHIEVGCDRSAERWKQERETWGEMVDWLGSRGTEVNRIK